MTATIARSVMTRDVICMNSDETLDAAWDAMQQFSIRHLPVLEAEQLVGVVSDRDVLLHATPGANGALVVPRVAVRTAMTPVPLTCRPGSSIREVVDTMIAHRIDCLPVMDGPRTLVGMVTTTDLLMLLQQFEGEGHRALPFSWRLLRGADVLAASG